MSGDKCNLCGMKVLNMEVHMKLNHKKRKSTKTEWFRFAGYGASTAAPAPLPSITKYQKTQNTIPDKGGSKNTFKSDTENKFKSTKPGTSYSQVTNSASAKNKQYLHKSLAMLGNLMDEETAKTIYKLDDVTDSDMKDIFKSGTITKESFELKLKLLGMIKIGNTYKKKDGRYTKYCQDCGVAFYWDRGKQRGKNLEYFDHIKTCGIESNYSNNKTQEVETQKEIAKLENIEQLEPEIDMCIKEEIEIKKEDPNDVYDPNIVVKNEHQYEVITNANIAVKKEPSDTGDIDSEANYGEQLMLKKLEVKSEPVESLEQVYIDSTDNKEVMTTVKTAEESEDFETLSLELTIVSTEESFDNTLLNSVCLNDLGDLFKDRSKLDIEAPTENDDVGETSKDSQSNTDNLGDAWFKKISEMERKKTQGEKIHKNKGKRVIKKTNTVTEPVFIPHNRQRKKVVK